MPYFGERDPGAKTAGSVAAGATALVSKGARFAWFERSFQPRGTIVWAPSRPERALGRTGLDLLTDQRLNIAIAIVPLAWND